MIALSPKKFQTFPQYTPPPCGSSMARWCPRRRVATKLAIISGMKRFALSLIALTAVLTITTLPCAAKTKIVRVFGLKDAQGKSVGTVSLFQQGSGVGLKLKLHDLPPGEH